MKLDNAKKISMSKILEALRENEHNIAPVLNNIGQHLKESGVPHSAADAIRWAEIMLGKSPSVQSIQYVDNAADQSLSIKSIVPVSDIGLQHYFIKRKIQIAKVIKYANQAWVFNYKTQKSFVALTFKNESGGDEIVNQHIASTSGKQDITFIRGKIYKPKGLHIFKNILDFLALLSFKKVDVLNEDSIILNSWSNLSKVTPYIKGYGYKFICCWLEDSNTGRAATISIRDFIKTEVGTRFINMVNFYKENVSLYDWYLNYSDNPSS